MKTEKPVSSKPHQAFCGDGSDGDPSAHASGEQLAKTRSLVNARNG
jgi:hypothetical protein